MRHILHSFSGAALAVAGIVSLATGATAQTPWPSARQITLVHPFAAGSDYPARVVAAGIEPLLGQKINVEPRPGAGGAIGTGFVARQEPDGYTFVMAYPGPAANYANTFSALPYKPLTDFEHITQIAVSDMALIARKDFPANTLQELIAYAKANPDKVTVGNNGTGSYGHMMALLLADQVGIKITHVPYKGGTQIATDMMSGNLDLSSDYYGATYAAHIQSGALKVIAIPSARRAAALPNTQTFREAGVDIVAAPWAGLMAPKGTPRAIIDKMNAAVANYLATDDAKTKFANVGQTPKPTSPEEFRDIVMGEEAMWRDTIKKHNIKTD
jgi:tripartite-type tricarboxylate transporter receptor subunit TctC